MTQIVVTYTTTDRYRKCRRFVTLAAAQRFAHNLVGDAPSLGHTYAVSDDGIGKITVRGATLLELFPACDDGNPNEDGAYDPAYDDRFSIANCPDTFQAYNDPAHRDDGFDDCPF